jgi:hypothetical protein
VLEKPNCSVLHKLSTAIRPIALSRWVIGATSVTRVYVSTAQLGYWDTQRILFEVASCLLATKYHSPICNLGIYLLRIYWSESSAPPQVLTCPSALSDLHVMTRKLVQATEAVTNDWYSG